MTQPEFLQRVRQGDVQGAWLLEGEEELLKQEALNALRSRLLPEGLEQLNESLLTAPETGDLMAACETLPFMASRRLVVVRDLPVLTGRAEADPVLTDYLPNVPETTVLLFYQTGKANGNKSLVKTLKKMNRVVTVERLRGAALSAWITQCFAERGKTCSRPVADQLAFRSGTDAAMLRGEIDKLCGYAGDRAEITLDDVRTVASPSAEYQVFDIINAVVAGNSQRALSLLSQLLRNGEEPVGILALLLRQFRLMQQCKIMQYEKLPRQEILDKLGGGYGATKMMESAGAYSAGQVRRGVNLLLDAEYRLKSGQWNADGVAETAVLQLIALRG